MSRMTESQRAQFDRPELGHSTPLLSDRSGRWSVAFTVVALLVAGVLCVAAVAALDSWAQWLVLGVVVMTTVGLVIAINPNRRG
jgi:hypothetical protein